MAGMLVGPGKFGMMNEGLRDARNQAARTHARRSLRSLHRFSPPPPSSRCACPQVETLAQFGVVFLLFALGIEFSLAKMQGVQAVALGGGVLQIVLALIIGATFSSNMSRGVFIGEQTFKHTGEC